MLQPEWPSSFIQEKFDREYVLCVLPNAYAMYSRYGEIVRSEVVGSDETGYEIIFVVRPNPDIVLKSIPRWWEFVPVTLCFCGAD